MAIPVEKLDVFKYNISKLSIIAPGWSQAYEIDPSKINSLSIVNNYDKAIVPQISIDFTAPYATYYDIIAASKNLEVSFTVTVANTGPITDSESGLAALDTYTTEWVNVKMRATNQGYVHTRDVVENQLDISENTESVEGTELRMRLYLYDSQKLIAYRRNKSFILNGNMNDALYAMLSARKMDNIIITPSTDLEKIDYMIPYGDLGQNLYDLNRNYGIYDYNYLFFMGLDRTYMISKGNLGRDTEFGELGTVNVYVEPYDAETPNVYAGCYRDDVNKIYVIGTSEAQIDDVDTLADYAYGGKITSSVVGTKTNLTDKVGTYEIEKSHAVANKKLHNQIIHSLKESQRHFNANFKNIDLGIITPNKKYVVISNDKYYDREYEIAGDYRLASSTIALNPDGNGSFVAAVALSLLKIS